MTVRLDVGGCHLHLQIAGGGPGPTVVLESGSLMPAVLWHPVQVRVAAFAPVVSYDRAGYGLSDPAPADRTPDRVVCDLQTLLQRAAVPGPYILVGHSLGGAYARLFASRFPDHVAGLVLVDAYNEHLRQGYTPTMRRIDRSSRRLLALLAHLGLPQLLFRRNPAVLTGGHGDWLSAFPEELRREVFRQMYTPRLTRAASREWDHIEALEEQLRHAPPLGDLPLVVLSKGRFDRVGGPGMKDEDWERFQQADRNGQAALVGLSSRGEQIVLAECGHMPPLEAPDAVAGAIGSVVAAVRSKTTAPAHPSNG